MIPDSIAYSDCWRGYNVLDVSGFRHYPINHSSGLQTDKTTLIALRISGISEAAPVEINSVPRENFGLFLKECEWRFNNPNPQAQLKQPKQWVAES